MTEVEKHSQGEWGGYIGGNGSFQIENSSGAILCQRSSWPTNEAESKANGALIMAAPKLLEALKRQTDWVRAALDCKAWHWDADQREAAEFELAAARAAIAKATQAQP